MLQAHRAQCMFGGLFKLPALQADNCQTMKRVRALCINIECPPERPLTIVQPFHAKIHLAQPQVKVRQQRFGFFRAQQIFQRLAGLVFLEQNGPHHEVRPGTRLILIVR